MHLYWNFKFYARLHQYFNSEDYYWDITFNLDCCNIECKHESTKLSTQIIPF